ncbi:hypothetical protein [Niveispirillum irakense]|uniref:hypothetical protein n=1 Tax=Niveispirillum irakense TaxID=34011 RepID=UPI0012B61C67|nr:hypothetical protein [Niveispirillum irakense]
MPGGYFCLSRDNNDPVFNVHLGDVWGKINFRTLRDSFAIDEKSEDARLLTVVEKGLKYVKEIRPGDSIPRELLDGSASWRVDEHHLMVARGRLTLQLVSWITGREEMITDRYKLEQLIEDPNIKQRAQEAFAKLAKQFGLPEERKQEMVDKVDHLARELSYIEALRERYAEVQKIMVRLGQAKRVFRSDQQLSSEVSRMIALAKAPVSTFDDIFDQIDGQTSEVMAMLRSFDAQITFIRGMRDELHTMLMVWDEMIEMWHGHEIDRDPETEGRLKRTYQFLAKNFLISKVWQRNG